MKITLNIPSTDRENVITNDCYELAHDEVVCYDGMAPFVEMISWKYENEELIIEIQYSELILNNYKYKFGKEYMEQLNNMNPRPEKLLEILNDPKNFIRDIGWTMLKHFGILTMKIDKVKAVIVKEEEEGKDSFEVKYEDWLIDKSELDVKKHVQVTQGGDYKGGYLEVICIMARDRNYTVTFDTDELRLPTESEYMKGGFDIDF